VIWRRQPVFVKQEAQTKQFESFSQFLTSALRHLSGLRRWMRGIFSGVLSSSGRPRCIELIPVADLNVGQLKHCCRSLMIYGIYIAKNRYNLLDMI